MSQSEFNVWSKWDPLKKVVIGTCLDQNYFEHVKNIEIKEKLTQILIETQEDLDNFAGTLESLGVKVLRGNPQHQIFPKRLDPDRPARDTVKVLLYPRDYYMVLGNNLIASHHAMISQDYYPEITSSVKNHTKSAWHNLLIDRKINGIIPPSWTLIGKDLFVDTQDYCINWIKNPPDWFKQKTIQDMTEWAKQWLPEVDVHWLDIGGHNDGTFHACKPGVIISLHDIQKYAETFPGWDVLYLPDQSWDAVDGFLKIKDKTEGKYWIPGEENNQQLLDFINSWLNEWVGFVEETVFDVNCLMVNQNTVCVSNYNKQVFDFFKKHKIEPIICPIRHRYFWDGGLHCVSLDLYREGECQSYINYT